MARHLVIRYLLIACWMASHSSSANAQQAAAVAAEPQPAAVAAKAKEEQIAEENAGDLVEAVEDKAVEDKTAEPEQPVIIDMAIANDPMFLMLKRYVTVQSALARRASELSEQTETELAKMNDAWLATCLNSAKRADGKIVQGVARFFNLGVFRMQNPNQNRNAPQQILKRAKEEIDKHLDSLLTPEQLAAFHDERAACQKFRRLAMAEVIVDLLDQRVYLKSEQREQLLPEIEKSLSVDIYWQFYLENQAYLPVIGTNVQKLLTPAQREALDASNSWDYDVVQMEMQMIANEPVFIKK